MSRDILYTYCECVYMYMCLCASHNRRLACLKYLVLANMLMKSGINPFDSQEVHVLAGYTIRSIYMYTVHVKGHFAWLINF